MTLLGGYGGTAAFLAFSSPQRHCQFLMKVLGIETTFLEPVEKIMQVVSAAAEQCRRRPCLAERNKCLLKGRAIQEPGSEQDTAAHGPVHCTDFTAPHEAVTTQSVPCHAAYDTVLEETVSVVSHYSVWWGNSIGVLYFSLGLFLSQIACIDGLTAVPLLSVIEEDTDSWSAELEEIVNGTTVSSIIFRS